MFTAIAEAASSSAGAASGGLIGLLLPFICIIAIFILIWYGIANNFAAIASDKGYTEKKWFHYCFWLGPVGMLMVCAMPDKRRRQ